MTFPPALVAVLLVGSMMGPLSPSLVKAEEFASAVRLSLAEVKVAGTLTSNLRKQIPDSITFETPQADLEVFRDEIEPTLRKACFECHGSETAEADIRVDTLDPDLLHGDDVSWWLEVSSAVSNGEMPPEDGPDLADEDRKKIIEWLSAELQKASQVRRLEQGRSSFRRMTRYEYNYALQDLLGLKLDFTKDLPPDPISPDGFMNSSDMLQMTGKQYAEYLEVNRRALNHVTVGGERPEVLYWGVSAEQASASQFAELETKNERAGNQRQVTQARNGQRGGQRRGEGESDAPRGGPAHYKNTQTGQTVPATWSYTGAVHAWSPTTSSPEVPDPSDFIAVLPSRQRIVVELGNRLPDKGAMRVRVRAWRTSADQTPAPKLALEFGWQGDKDQRASFRISKRDVVVDASPEEPVFYQWDIPLSEISPRNPVRKTVELGTVGETNPSEYIRLFNTSSDPSVDIQFDYVEVSAPVYDKWPPETHSAIFIESKNCDDEEAYAREILSHFMRRAWRREVTESEVDLQMALFDRVRPICSDFEQAVVETLAAVLSSPRFLYLVPSDRSSAEASRTLNDFELATRLSIFLWCSTPDDELLDLAAKGQLRHPENLIRQTHRMLADPRHERFSKHFVQQWLNMAPLEFVRIDRRTYPQFDDELKDAMQQEPIALFEEMLQNDSSVIDFIHADYAVVNERLAQHYKIEGVRGNEFQKVSLDPEDDRGGLLTQAGLMAMNSDGKDSHPLKRGMWLLESILNDPPPPPPPAVPEIDLADPEIMKMTPKQQMEDHRNQAACMSCHVKIDPWGIAFENLDALGIWRTESSGKDIDASSLLYNEHELNGVDGVKRFLLANRQDQFARAIVHKMTTFALGRPLTFGDRADVERIAAQLRQNGDGLQTLVRLIVESDVFQRSEANE
ncbi:DUF1592 domain-containing protein [Aporhodopirellula aestuarii]|uniref:DUF1592 domain-containing protein n=1 Tax=Aporhodopirellula aestuarii TaxID=2950107 RepID=A0ABT0U6Y6_9BACT|nr:DUF1592 domain-containing protein [Aporhodopirellula aestuarii]MCM2372663.1 DUF1592 domain-containing protein [Aporhodopirellula aestuarii]